MKIYSHELFDESRAEQNTCYRVQPVTGTRLKDNQIILQVYGTSRTNLWQRLKGVLNHE